MKFSSLPGLSLFVVILLATTAPGADSTGAGAKPPMQAYLEKLGYIAVPLELKDNKHVLNGKLNDRSIRIMVGTGFSVTTVTTREGKRLKTPADYGKSFNDPVLGRISGDDFKLIEQLDLGSGKLPMQPARVRGLNISGVANPELIIGMDLLVRYHCLIDCLELRLYLRADAPSEAVSKALVATLDKSGFSRVPARERRELIMTCNGSVNGKPLEWLIDTGSFWSVLDSATSSRLNLNAEFTGWRAVGTGNIGSTKLRVAEAREIELGGLKFKRVDLGVADLSNWNAGRGRDDDLKIDAILGMEQLVKHNALIDCAAGNLWVHPGDDELKR